MMTPISTNSPWLVDDIAQFHNCNFENFFHYFEMFVNREISPDELITMLDDCCGCNKLPSKMCFQLPCEQC
jgi:hypothetical protein